MLVRISATIFSIRNALKPTLLAIIYVQFAEPKFSKLAKLKPKWLISKNKSKSILLKKKRKTKFDYKQLNHLTLSIHLIHFFLFLKNLNPFSLHYSS